MIILEINRNKILTNLNIIRDICKKNQLSLLIATKCCCSHPELVDFLYKEGILSIGDSNYSNFHILNNKLEKHLIKTSISDIKTGLEYCDLIYISDFSFINELSGLPGQKKVILNVELGDYKEGILPEKIIPFIQKCEKIHNIKICGIAGNLGCMSGKLPDKKTLNIMSELSIHIKKETSLKNPIVSMGGTVILDSIQNNLIGTEINEIRIGEGLFFGFDSSHNSPIPGMDRTAFILSGEGIEVKEKNINLKNNTGFNAFGYKRSIISTGIRKRAILSFGSLASPMQGLIPVCDDIIIDGMTYDFTVVDITDYEGDIKAGDFIQFYTDYNAVAHAMINPYVTKKLI